MSGTQHEWEQVGESGAGLWEKTSTGQMTDRDIRLLLMRWEPVAPKVRDKPS